MLMLLFLQLIMSELDPEAMKPFFQPGPGEPKHNPTKVSLLKWFVRICYTCTCPYEWIEMELQCPCVLCTFQVYHLISSIQWEGHLAQDGQQLNNKKRFLCTTVTLLLTLLSSFTWDRLP